MKVLLLCHKCKSLLKFLGTVKDVHGKTLEVYECPYCREPKYFKHGNI